MLERPSRMRRPRCLIWERHSPGVCDGGHTKAARNPRRAGKWGLFPWAQGYGRFCCLLSLVTPAIARAISDSHCDQSDPVVASTHRLFLLSSPAQGRRSRKCASTRGFSLTLDCRVRPGNGNVGRPCQGILRIAAGLSHLARNAALHDHGASETLAEPVAFQMRGPCRESGSPNLAPMETVPIFRQASSGGRRRARACG